MTQEQNEEISYLLSEYKQKRDQLNELQKDVNSVRDALVTLFQRYKIHERIYGKMLYKLNTRVIYVYPASCKKHAKKKESTPFIQMSSKLYT